jgi:hypothetical protein
MSKSRIPGRIISHIELLYVQTFAELPAGTGLIETVGSYAR